VRARRQAIWGFTATAVWGACIDVADDRALRDQRVGQAQAAGLSVAVDEGLAAVRELTASEMTLWAQAPAIAFSLTRSEGAGPLTITGENLLPDADLFFEDGRPVTALPANPGSAATSKRWAVDLLPGQSARFLLAPPDRESRDPFRFAVYADVQGRVRDVQDIYRRMNNDPSIRFALMNGDLTDTGTVQQLARFQRELRTLPFPIYATLGNHELGTEGPPFHDFHGRGNFSFAFRAIRFTLLDSASATLAPLVYEWLGGWLAEGSQSFHVVSMHVPPLDPVGERNGAFASRLEAHRLVSQLAAAGVDLTFYGHVHSFYAFANAGIPAYITGGGGGIPERFDGIGRHFLTVDVDPATQLHQVAVVRVD
jgi:3',5'-cyclic-AMP phosphodiesterase